MGTDDLSDLSKFLKRPVKIAEFVWPVAGNVDITNYPMNSLLNNAAIARKIANFRNLHGQLHIKVVLNGNPFYYGRLLASWEPYSENVLHHSAPLKNYTLMQRSQRMHLLLDPSTSEPAYFTVPFFFPRQSINLLEGQDAVSFGALQFMELNQLGHANGSTDSVNVSVFAWMDNVDLGAPTANPSTVHPSGTDEREGKVYKIASKIGTVASMFTDVPTIAPLASALEKSSMATAKVAKLFGWSKPEKDYGSLMIPFTTDDMATTDGQDAVRRLVGDTKQGLTIDPRTAGLPPSDELAVSELVKKESYLKTFTWSGESSGDRLGTLLIDPGINEYDVASYAHQYTPMGIPALSHKYWTGSLNVRLQIVCSKFHRGRLLVQYDPEDYVNANPETNVAYSHIMDISECTNATFNIGWGQNAPFREVYPPIATQVKMSSTPFGNGYLSIYVLNELVSVLPAPQIDINVFVSGGEDMRFAGPTGSHVPRIALYPPDFPFISPTGLAEHDVIKFQPTVVPRSIFHEHFGETTVSLRSLMKRYNFYSSAPLTCPASAAAEDLVSCDVNMPNYPAFTNINFDTVIQPDDFSILVSTLNGNNYSSNNATTLMTFVGSCFAAMRGGVRWGFVHKLMARGGSDNDYGIHQAHGFVSRSSTSEVRATVVARPVDEISLSTRTIQGLGWPENFQNGAMVTDLSNNSMVKVEVPFYSNLRFSQANLAKIRIELGEVAETEGLSGVRFVSRHIDDISAEHVTSTLLSYVACAEDFSLLWFQCVPTIYFISRV